MSFRNAFEEPSGGGGGPHAILSATHTDADETKAPVGGDLFKFVGGMWVPGRAVWGEIQDKPATFPPDPHPHDLATTTADGFMARADKGKLTIIGDYCRLERRANQPTGTSNGWYTVSWDTEVSDAPGYYDPANPTRITPPDGLYSAAALSVWSANSTGVRAARVQRWRSGVTVTVTEGPLVSAAVDRYGRVPTSGNIEIVAGDYLTVDFFHSSGSAITIGRNAVTGLPEAYFGIVRIK